MAHSLITPPPSTTCTISINSRPCIDQRVCTSHQCCSQVFTDKLSTRRNVSLELVGAVLGLSVIVSGERNAYAAARRPPPPPPEERNDPNVSGLQAKVLASKKRKEAMKQAMAKLRERGKPVVKEPSE